MRVKFIPRHFFLSREEFDLFCMLIKYGVRQTNFLTNIPFSTLYRKLTAF